MGDVILRIKKVRYTRYLSLFYNLIKFDFFYFRFFLICSFFFLLNYRFECKHIYRFFFCSNNLYNFYIKH